MATSTNADLGARRLATQFELSRLLSSETSLQAATPAILRAIAESIGAVVAELWIVDQAATMLRCAGIWCAPDVEPHDFEVTTRPLTFARGDGLPGKVWSSTKPAWIVDVAFDAAFARKHVAAALDLHGAVAFPIQFAGDTTGVVEFFYRAQRTPDAELLALFADVGSQLGLFVERARMDDALMRQARDIVSLSTPVLEVWERVLVAPVIGTLDGDRANHFMQRVLTRISETRARMLLIDVTGMPLMDTHVARRLGDTARAAQLIGTRVILTGVSPRIAYTLAELGIDMAGVDTAGTLASGLRRAVAMLGEVV